MASVDVKRHVYLLTLLDSGEISGRAQSLRRATVIHPRGDHAQPCFNFGTTPPTQALHTIIRQATDLEHGLIGVVGGAVAEDDGVVEFVVAGTVEWGVGVLSCKLKHTGW